jgi:hypothetical protein
MPESTATNAASYTTLRDTIREASKTVRISRSIALDLLGRIVVSSRIKGRPLA